MRPEGWKNPYIDTFAGEQGISYQIFEAGADAMLEALWKKARESPTRTFTLDANVVNIFGEKE
tara:strand:- start:504 stop:692 length:189 start_codon:yes stop_codon:yes gene_type:complete